MKRWSTWLINREMQIKTTTRYHFPPVRIKKSTNNKCWWGCGEKGAFIQCWWKCEYVQPLLKTIWGIHQNTKNRTTISPSNPPTGYIPWKKTILWKDTCHPSVHCSTITRARTWKPPKCPSAGEWIKKLWYIYIMEYYSYKRTKLGHL